MSQGSEWKSFNAAMMNGDKVKARKIMAGMKDAGNRDSARRWLDGPNAAERAESKARQAAINAVTDKECARHCDTGFLTRGGDMSPEDKRFAEKLMGF